MYNRQAERHVHLLACHSLQQEGLKLGINPLYQPAVSVLVQRIDGHLVTTLSAVIVAGFCRLRESAEVGILAVRLSCCSSSGLFLHFWVEGAA